MKGNQHPAPAWIEAIQRWEQRGYEVQVNHGERGVSGITILNDSTEIFTRQNGYLSMQKPVAVYESHKSAQEMINAIDDWLKIAESPLMTANALAVMDSIRKMMKAPLRSWLVESEYDIDQFVNAVRYLLNREEKS